jgi:hypothetical protein
MQTYLAIGLIVVVILAMILWTRAQADRSIAKGSGRLTIDAQPAASQVTLPASSGAAAQADAIESAISGIPDIARAPNIFVKRSIRTVIKVPTKELADAIAQRERAKGMDVEVSPPDANESKWIVTSQNVGG